METFIKKQDSLTKGIIVALLLPIITFFVCFLSKAKHMEFGTFTNLVFHFKDYRVNILTLCLLPNMFLFYFVNFRFKMGQFTKGLVLISLLLVIAIVISSFE
jgi:hypothetical protein